MATKEEIIEYVMNSPQNTNRSVLNSMLEHMEGAEPEPQTVTIPVYMQVGGAEPVYHSEITAILGSPVEKTYVPPAGTTSILDVKWDNTDIAHFRINPARNGISGYMPFTDTEHQYFIVVWETK